jgi:hypothetical protein
VRRFEQECSTLALLKHRNIVAHYDNGVTDEDQPFLVMEYLDGVTLKQLIEESGSLEVKEALSIFIQACAGLAAAHEKSIVHRDMKPANIMVLRDEQAVVQVKILDFGVAKLLIQGETFQTKTQTGEMLGTLLYMSPEQCLDQDLDGRSDVYSLGCVLYEALTGKPPICGRTAFETMNKHLSEKPQKLAKVRPDAVFPARLEQIVQKAVEKDPAQRYQKITLMQDQLEQLLKQILATPFLQEHFEEPRKVHEVTGTQYDSPPEIELDESAYETPIELPIEQAKATDGYEDRSREGTIGFLARESMDGVAWRRIYADAIKWYSITEQEVLVEQRRLVSGHYNLKAMEKFSLERFDALDRDADGFVSKEELRYALNAIGRNADEHAPQKHGKDKRIPDAHMWQEVEFITFLLHHLDDIRHVGQSEQHAWPRLPTGVSKEDITEYFRNLRGERVEDVSSPTKQS